MTILAKFIVKPRNIKAMFRYRWMANYLAVPMMVDRHTQGLRDEYLRICHLEQDLVISPPASSAATAASATIRSFPTRSCSWMKTR